MQIHPFLISAILMSCQGEDLSTKKNPTVRESAKDDSLIVVENGKSTKKSDADVVESSKTLGNDSFSDTASPDADDVISTPDPLATDSPTASPSPSPSTLVSNFSLPRIEATSRGVSSFINKDGALYTWGLGQFFYLGYAPDTCGISQCRLTPKLVTDQVKFAQFSAPGLFGFNSTALAQDGTVYTWGTNSIGYKDDPLPRKVADISNIVEVTSGLRISLAIDRNNDAWAWGDNTNHQLADGTTTYSEKPKKIAGLSNVAKLRSYYTSVYAIKKNGDLYGWGFPHWTFPSETPVAPDVTSPTLVPGINSIADLVASFNLLALKTNGEVWTWGRTANSGALGLGDLTTIALTPRRIDGLSDIVAIASYGVTSFALRKDGLVFGWGLNRDGVIGIPGGDPCGNTFCYVRPTLITTLPKLKYISCGADYCFGVTMTDNKYITWGRSRFGSMANGLNVNESRPPAEVTMPN